MAFDINDPNIQEIFQENEEVSLDDVSAVSRDRKNKIRINENQRNKFLEVTIPEKRFEKNEFNRLVNNQISELSN